MRTFASQGLTPQIVISYPISSHLHHICASSYLRFLSQISTSSLSSSGLHILRPHLVFTRSDLHRRVTLSLSYHLQDFIMQLLSQLYNLIYLYTSSRLHLPPLSGQPSSSDCQALCASCRYCAPRIAFFLVEWISWPAVKMAVDRLIDNAGRRRSSCWWCNWLDFDLWVTSTDGIS